GGIDDENKGQQLQPIMNMLERVSATIHAPVVVTDHFGKDVLKGLRGHSSKPGSAFVILGIYGEPGGTHFEMVIDKNRAGLSKERFPFTMVIADMGVRSEEHTS